MRLIPDPVRRRLDVEGDGLGGLPFSATAARLVVDTEVPSWACFASSMSRWWTSLSFLWAFKKEKAECSMSYRRSKPPKTVTNTHHCLSVKRFL